jgi:predicted flap endonuclease-1-like 5' DNA nuclease
VEKTRFLAYLKKRGKKEHVCQYLADLVMMLEGYAAKSLGKELVEITPQELRAYLHSHEVQANQGNKNLARAIALYYAMLASPELVKAANSFRQAELEKERQPMNLSKLIGVDKGHMARLKQLGILNAAQLLERSRTKAERVELAARAGIPYARLLELVKLADLTRIMGVKAVRARLYVDAGVDTLDAIAANEPDAFVQLIHKFVAETGLQGVATLPKEAEFTIREAKRLPRVVVYDE